MASHGIYDMILNAMNAAKGIDNCAEVAKVISGAESWPYALNNILKSANFQYLSKNYLL